MTDRDLPRWLVLATGLLLLLGTLYALVAANSPPLAALQFVALVILGTLWLMQARDKSAAFEHRRAMVAASQELSSKANLDEVLDYVAGVLLQGIPGADKCVIHLLDDQGQRLVPRYSSQPDHVRTAGLPADKGVAGRALKDRCTIVVNDVAHDSRFLPLDSSRFQSLLVAPLLGGCQPIGTLSMNSKQTNAFSHADEVLISAMAALVSGYVKNANASAKDDQELLYIESLVHRITDGIVILDAERCLVRYNPALAHLLGASVNHLLNQKVDLQSDEMGLRLLAKLVEGLPHPLRGSYERQVEIHEPVHAILQVRVDQFDGSGEEGRIIILVQDRTEDQDLIRAEAELMMAASRELLPALDSIRGHATLIKSFAGSPQAKSHWPSVIQEESARLMSLGQDLAALHAIHAHRLRIHPEPTDLRDMLDELRQTFSSLARLREVALAIQCQTNLAPVRLDGALLGHALSNLIQNAIHRSSPGGRITIAAEASLTDVMLTLSDDGETIPAGAQARIFHGLFRSDGSAPEQPAGTGLGLYVARRMIEAHDGTLWMPEVDGVLGDSQRGATFRCVLPLEQHATSGAKLDAWREVLSPY